MDFSVTGKQLQTAQRLHNRNNKQAAFKGVNCQPLGPLQKSDVFVSSKPKANQDIAFGSKIGNKIKNIWNKITGNKSSN